MTKTVRDTRQPLSLADRATQARKRFHRDERGSMIVFGLFVFVLLILAGGMAVDLMRTETARTRLQSTLDRAVLAAAGFEQDQDPETVVRDYVAKAGLSDFLIDVDVTDTAGLRSVRVDANVNVASFFMDFIGIRYLPAPASSAAGESTANLEIALVLDVSQSMDGSKLEELKDAAQEFVDTILLTTDPDRVKISVIPYATQVSVPPTLLDLLIDVFNREHSYSSCIDFDDEDFLTPSILPPTLVLSADQLKQSDHFDPFYNWGPEVAPANGQPPVHTCNPNESQQLLPMAHDGEALNDYIEGLISDGNTSIDIGMKWAAATLDPAMGNFWNLTVTSLGSFLFNPIAPWGDSSTDKVIVLMTDGHNSDEFRLPDDFPRWSEVYYDDLRGEYWVKAKDDRDADGDGRRSSDNWFWVDARVNRQSNFWRKNDEWPYAPEVCHEEGYWYLWRWVTRTVCEITPTNIEPNLRRLSYDELFDRVSLYYNAYYHHYLQNYDNRELNTWFYDLRERADIEPGTKNARLHNMCNTLKANDVQIYAIGFDVEDEDVPYMADCASSSSHFMRVAPNNLNDAFGSIARQLTVLRLTQ
ncbi:TadE/TadG family protein [Pelagovum pacificum]|uniref:VWA domain-containing protein n=1 Tax=Pelagovum pacificum TaxID=2588711 RepID=A0A5C5GIB2_9RHOB|nr:TadE/TadG family protein [Pelagovum pacificum]QQA43680.1 TadE/TadG family protein [Pelagovum pacificum]TNY33186.1 VWA domain-containing protein [Pelagovum pacificum]